MLQLAATPSFQRAGRDAAPKLVRLDGLGLTIETWDGLEGLAPLWDTLAASSPPPVFQSHGWLAAWCRTAAPVQGERPLIAAVRSTDGQLQMLLPLGLKRIGGATVAGFLGQAHANYGVALMEPGFQRWLTSETLSAVLRALARAHGIAAYHLANQPVVWNGLPNPFARWSALTGANDSYVLPLDTDFEALADRLFSKRTRSMLRRKARKLAGGGKVWMGIVTGDTERRQLLEAFLSWKGEQLAAQGADNIFAAPGTAAFYARLLDLPQSAARVEVRALKVGGAPVAIALTAAADGRQYLLNMALAPDAPRDCSPGAILLHDDIAAACRDGSTAYDFGPGAAAYKAAWLPETLALTTSIFPVTPTGLPAAAMLAAATLAKRAIKRSSVLWPLAQRLRRSLRGNGTGVGE